MSNDPTLPTRIDPAAIVRSASDDYARVEGPPQVDRRLCVETVTDIGKTQAAAIETMQRHATGRHAMSTVIALTGIGALLGLAAFDKASGPVATAIGAIVCAAFGLRAFEVWKGDDK